MRTQEIVAGAMVAVISLSGCATFRDRQWGTCAIAGAVIGATAAGVAGGVAVNNAQDHPENANRGAAIGGGIVGGGLLGALIGHAVCDPVKAPPPPPPVAEVPPPPPPPAKGTKLAVLGAAHFDFDKAQVKPAGKKILDDAVKTMKDNPNIRVVVEGHTDAIGSEAYNQRLSERRANAVRDYLVSQGVESSRVRTQGFGKSRPVADNKTAEGRAQNRRAEVIVD